MQRVGHYQIEIKSSQIQVKFLSRYNRVRRQLVQHEELNFGRTSMREDVKGVRDTYAYG